MDYVARHIIGPQAAERTSQVLKPQFVRFQKCLLRRPSVRPMKCRSARHAAHRKHLDPDPLAVQVDVRLVPMLYGEGPRSGLGRVVQDTAEARNAYLTRTPVLTYA